jgi:hypothetical protein
MHVRRRFRHPVLRGGGAEGDYGSGRIVSSPVERKVTA